LELPPKHTLGQVPGILIENKNDAGDVTSVTFTPENAKNLLPDAKTDSDPNTDFIRVKCENPNTEDKVSRVETDPNLPIHTLDPDLEKEWTSLFTRYNITEPTLTLAQKIKLTECISPHDAVFSTGPYDLGCINHYIHRIDTGKLRLYAIPPRPVAFPLRAGLLHELKELVKLQVIRPSSSSWASAIVLVPKPDATRRLCMDFRNLNAIADSTAYPLPKITDIFAALHGAKYFTSLDISKGFWQIPIHPEDCHKTAFVTPFGQFEWTRLPMGLNSSPGVFQKVMTEILGGLIWVNCLVYIDDILIFTDTFEKHLEVLDDVLGRLTRAGLKLRGSKCEIARTQVKYLGHILNSSGIHVNPAQVEAVKAWPIPTCVKDVESFLGKVNYYNKFIPDYSKVAAPLFALKKKHAVWNFDEHCMKAFETLRDAICQAPVLALPNFDLEFILTTDASGYGLGAVLSQNFPEGERPISYSSRTLHDAEWNYSNIEREALAIVWSCLHFEEYLEGRHFTIYTDHKPLLYLMKKNIDNKRLTNFAMKLCHLTFTIEHRPGPQNVVADALSRYPTKPPKGRRSKQVQTNESVDNLFDPNSDFAMTVPSFKPVASSIQAEEEQKAKAAKSRKKNKGQNSSDTVTDLVIDTSGDSVVHLTIPQIRVADVTRLRRITRNIRRFQLETPIIGDIYRYLEDGTLPNDPKLAKAVPAWATSFFINADDQSLRYVHHGLALVCMPVGLRDAAIFDAHRSVTAGHRGQLRTLKELLTHCWWPRMATDVSKVISTCGECLLHKPPPVGTRQPMERRPPPVRIWQRLHLDVWSPGHTTTRGNVCVIAYIDSFSKYLVAIPATNHNADTVMNTFKEHVGAVYGLPEELISDGAPELRGQVLSEFCAIFGILKHVVSPYRPEANGQIERVFATVRPLLATIAHHEPENWDEYIPYAVHAYNTSYHSSIGNTPFFLMYGRDPKPLTRLLQDVRDPCTSMQEALRRLHEARRYVAEHLEAAQDRAKIQHDRHAHPRAFNINDVVLLRVTQLPRQAVSKLYPKFVGPYRIMDIKHSVLSVIPIHQPDAVPKRIHSDKARHCDHNFMLPSTLEELDLPFVDPACVDPNIEAEAN